VLRTLSLRFTASLSLLAATLLLPALFSGCACFNKDNVPSLNFVEKHLVPESTTGQVVASPVVFPICLVALGVDIAIVHPAAVIPDAASDTKDALWDDLDWDKMYVTECAALPWRTFVTPVVFTGDFLGRAFFDIPGKAEQIRGKEKYAGDLAKAGGLVKEGKYAEDLAKAGRLVDEGKHAEAQKILKDIRMNSLPDKERQEMMFLELKVQCLTGNYESVNGYYLQDLLKSGRKQEVLALLDTCRKSDQPMVRWTACQALLAAYERETEKLRDLFRELMAEQDPVLRALALRFVGERGRSDAALLPDLKRVAQEDSNPTNRALAAHIVEQLGK
jgi:hypothetical protein